MSKTPDTVEVSTLPLFCPGPNSPKWNMHPRVFLDIAHAPDHKVRCPYCSTQYQLKAGVTPSSH